MREVSVRVFSTNVSISEETKEKRTLYQISSGTTFHVFVSTEHVNTSDKDFKQLLIQLGRALAKETDVDNVQKILKKHLLKTAIIELAVIFSSQTTQHYFSTGRFYIQRQGTLLKGPVIESDGLTPKFKPLNWSESLPIWQTNKEKDSVIDYAANSAAQLDLDPPQLTVIRDAILTCAGETTVDAAEPSPHKLSLSNDTDPSLSKIPPFPVKTFAAGGAISALGAVALVMTLTAKYAGSHAVVGLVGMKAMSLFWPIALGVGSTLVLGSLYHYAKQRGLFSSCPGIPFLNNSSAAVDTKLRV